MCPYHQLWSSSGGAGGGRIDDNVMCSAVRAIAAACAHSEGVELASHEKTKEQEKRSFRDRMETAMRLYSDAALFGAVLPCSRLSLARRLADKEGVGLRISETVSDACEVSQSSCQ